MYTDSEAYRIFEIVENTLQQTINLLNISLNFPIQYKYFSDRIYNNLFTFEDILLSFLYLFPIAINHEFVEKVNTYLTIIYEYKIKYSRYI